MIEDFGTLPNGEAVKRFTIGNADLNLTILSYGATLQWIKRSGAPFSLCVGYETLDDYLTNPGCAGAIVGRVANRIGGGRAEIDGKSYLFDRNENGRHTLHGGAGNLAFRNWSLVEVSPTSLRLETQLPDGDNGFPGALEVSAEYSVGEGCEMTLVLEARTGAPTLCNLAPHPYFNLNGSGDARDQTLLIHASEMTETDSEKIPTGNLIALTGTPWDHRIEKTIAEGNVAYDHNYCLGRERTDLGPVAFLTGLESGVTMQIETTEPGLQVYDGAGLNTPYAGIALEPQCWPDAPNHNGFPSILLRPGEISPQVTRFTFSQT